MPSSKSFYVDSLLTKSSKSSRDHRPRSRGAAAAAVSSWFAPMLPPAPLLMQHHGATGTHQQHLFCRRSDPSALLPSWFPCCALCVRGPQVGATTLPATTLLVSGSPVQRGAVDFPASVFQPHHHGLEHYAASASAGLTTPTEDSRRTARVNGDSSLSPVSQGAGGKVKSENGELVFLVFLTLYQT